MMGAIQLSLCIGLLGVASSVFATSSHSNDDPVIDPLSLLSGVATHLLPILMRMLQVMQIGLII